MKALTFLACAALLLSACAPRADDRAPDGRIIIDYWEKWTGFEGEAMQAVVDDFNASQDRFLVRMLTVSSIEQKLLLATAGGNPPDVAGLWSHSVNVYAEKSALQPLDRLLEAAGIRREQYTPVFWDLCTHRGFVWALPTTPATVALHWNRQMFREAGLDPEQPPRSIEELDRMSDRLTVVDVNRGGRTERVRYSDLTPEEKESGDFNLQQVGHLPSEPGWWNTLFVYWFGGRLWDGTNSITAVTPEQLACQRWYRGYTERYGLKNVQKFGSSFGNFSSPQNPFLSGRVAMVLQGVWMYNFIDKYAPHLEWAAAPFPSADPDRLPMVSIAECDVLVIPRGAPHAEGAFAFMNYVQSPAAMEKLSLGQRKFSPLAETSAEFMSRHPNPFVRTFIELAKSPQVQVVPRMSIWNEYAAELRVAIDRIYTLLASPEEALLEVQTRIQLKMDRDARRWSTIRDERLRQWRELSEDVVGAPSGG